MLRRASGALFRLVLLVPPDPDRSGELLMQHRLLEQAALAHNACPLAVLMRRHRLRRCSILVILRRSDPRGWQIGRMARRT
jgi:hypothetical protein